MVAEQQTVSQRFARNQLPTITISTVSIRNHGKDVVTQDLRPFHGIFSIDKLIKHFICNARGGHLHETKPLRTQTHASYR